jgi:hypothetical protein
MAKRMKRRVIRDSILIICGKTETEKNYFLGFKEKIRSATGRIILKIIDKGSAPLEIVEIAINEKKSMGFDSPYRHIWAVFDKDEYNIDKAITLAKVNDIHTAWTNEAFELWFIYHYEYFTSPLSRNKYKIKLDDHLNMEYSKSDPIIFKRLEKHMVIAIENARRSYQWHLLHEHLPADSNSCTTVYQLAELLRDWM